MSSADLLLYRPWSDVTRKSQEEPVDFSKKNGDIPFTDINNSENSKSENDLIVDTSVLIERYSEAVKYRANSSSANIKDDRRTPDSGFSSPSEGPYAAYHHLLPGLYQQALANHALQREVFYRDAIQREIFNRQQCQESEIHEQKPFSYSRKQNEQMSPLALVVKRNFPYHSNPDIIDSKCAQVSKKPKLYNEGYDSDNIVTRSDKFEGKLSEDLCGNDAFVFSNNTEDGRKVDSVEDSGFDESSVEKITAPPQTSPYHLLPPALYWPHGSTPIGTSAPKQMSPQFSSKINSSVDSHFNRSLPQCNNQLPLSPNHLSSPIKSPISKNLTNVIISNTVTSPIISPLARSAFELTMSMNNKAANVYNELSKTSALCSISPRTNTPIKTCMKSPIAGSSGKRKLLNNQSPDKKSKSPKKNKATRRLNFDEDKSSPVSGTIIRELVDGEEPLVVRKGDIDPAYNVVEITEEAKAEIAKIENKIGDYVCRLCKELYDDAFGLAQHRCSRIIHVEYRCPECDKVFNCPANLASHRRWHKPKGNTNGSLKVSSEQVKSENITRNISSGINNFEPEPSTSKGVTFEESSRPDEDTVDDKDSETYDCHICFKTFKRQAYLRKHLSTHKKEDGCLPDSIIQPIPHKFALHQASQQLTQALNTTGLSQSHHHSPHAPILSPISPPMFSPPFSPTEMVKCHLCYSTFFTPAALTIHYATAHRRDPRGDSSAFATNSGFVELALGNVAPNNNTTPSVLTNTLHIPRPQYHTGQSTTSHFPTHLLHVPAQISATS